MCRRFRHWKEVLKRAVRAAGWVANLVNLLVGTSVLGAGVFLLHERHRVFAVTVLAAGVLVALMEGSYLVWDATEKELQTARARLQLLDTKEDKRAYLDQQIAKAERLQRRIESIDSDQWARVRITILDDITHWESGVRADLRESFNNGADLQFDSDEGFGPSKLRSLFPEGPVEYLSVRIVRLREIKADL
jgi:hypothetical protein